MFMGIVNRICPYIDLGLLATLLRVLQRRIMNLPYAVRDFLPISPQIYEKKPMSPSRRELIFFFRFFSSFHGWHIVQMLSFVNLKMSRNCDIRFYKSAKTMATRVRRFDVNGL